MQIDTSIMGKEEYLECIKKLAKQFCNIYIYGAGVRGKMLFELLKDNQINVKAYVVTDKNMNREIWHGKSENNNYQIDITKNILSGKFTICTTKGKIKMMRINAYCKNGIDEKDKNKLLRKILSTKL